MNKYIRQGCQEQRERELTGMSDKSTRCEEERLSKATQIKMLSGGREAAWGHQRQVCGKTQPHVQWLEGACQLLGLKDPLQGSGSVLPTP